MLDSAEEQSVSHDVPSVRMHVLTRRWTTSGTVDHAKGEPDTATHLVALIVAFHNTNDIADAVAHSITNHKPDIGHAESRPCRALELS